MRRGLMAWDENELPRRVLGERIAGLQAAMTRGGFEGFVLYTNLVQPSAVTYLTGFTPYWSDGLLLVPKSGAPVFATALSKRVANWIASTNPLSEIVNTPKPGAAVGARLAADGCRRVGVLELDRLPGGLYDEIVEAAPTVELIDGSAAFASLRQCIDGAERGLIARADALAVAALAQVDPERATDAGAVAGLVEKQARLLGAEEAYIAVAPDLAAARRSVRAARIGRLQGKLGAPNPQLRPRPGRTPDFDPRRCMVRATRLYDRARPLHRSADHGAPRRASRRNAQWLDGGEPRRQLSAAGHRVIAHAQPERRSRRRLHGAERRACAR
jgi:hypothetical protein